MARDRCVSMDRTWGFLATDVPDPPECVLSCRQDFLRGLSLEDETLNVVCEALSDSAAVISVSASVSGRPVPVPFPSSSSSSSSSTATSNDESALWALYCCDAQRCGVDNLRRGGQDPNVNWFINSCQNIGHSSINDPGPPGLAYSCENLATDHPDSVTRCEYQGGQSVQAASDSAPSATTQTSMATQTYSTAPVPSSLEASLDPTQSDGNSDDSDSSSNNSNSNDNSRDNYESDGGISSGVKVTIALVAFAAAVILVLAILAFIRYRTRPPHRRNLGQYFKARYHSLYPPAATGPSPPPPLSPARPLISPKLPLVNRDGVPLTPPPPLKERRLLSDASHSPKTDAYRHHGRSLSAAGHALLCHDFPAVPPPPPPPPPPVYTTNKGNAARRSGFASVPPKARSQSGPFYAGRSSPLSPPTSPRGWIGSQKGVSAGPRTSTSSTIPAGGVSRIASTGPHSYRRGAANLELARLQSPGPPPDRALPSTPTNSYIGSHSPTWPSASPPQPGEIGVAIGLVSRNPATGVVPERESQDLCELTEQMHLEWQGTGGRWASGQTGCSGGSAAPPPPPPPPVAHRSTGSVRVASPVLEEVDLENMAGSY